MDATPPPPASATTSPPGILLMGAGSLLDPEIGAPVRLLTHALRDETRFAEVRLSFCHEMPPWREALATIATEEVVVVPVFICEDAWSAAALSAALGLTGACTLRGGGRRVRRAAPLGTHPAMIKVVMARADEALTRGNQPADATDLLLVGPAGHDDGPEDAALASLEATLRARERFASARALRVDQEAEIRAHLQRCQAPQVLVIPYLISNGAWTRREIPGLIGLGAGALAVSDVAVGKVDGRRVLYTSAVGTHPAMREVARARIAEALDAAAPSVAAAPDPWLDALTPERVQGARRALLDTLARDGALRLGDVCVRRDEAGWRLHHAEDEGLAGLRSLDGLRDLEACACVDARGAHRPLPHRADLQRGWQLRGQGDERLLDALALLYPAGVTLRFGHPPVTPWREHVARLPDAAVRGRLTRLDEGGLRRAVHACCGGLGCLRHPRWLGAPIDTGADAFPCPEVCPLLQRFALRVHDEEALGRADQSAVTALSEQARRTVEDALRALRVHSDAAIADFDDPANVAWITYLLARHYGWKDDV